MKMPMRRWVVEYVKGPLDGRFIGIEGEPHPAGQILVMIFEGRHVYYSATVQPEDEIIRVEFVGTDIEVAYDNPYLTILQDEDDPRPRS